MSARRRAALAATLALAALAIGGRANSRPEVPRAPRPAAIVADGPPALADPGEALPVADDPIDPTSARDDLDDDHRPRAPAQGHHDAARAAATPRPGAAPARAVDPAGWPRSFLILRRIRR